MKLLKRLLPLTILPALAIALSVCTPDSQAGPVEIHVSAAAPMTETVDQIIDGYKYEAFNVTVISIGEKNAILKREYITNNV